MSLLEDSSLAKFEKYLRNPIATAITTIVGSLAGLFGSVFTPEIKQSFPFEIALVAPSKVLLFWGMVILFGLLFGGAQWAQLRVTDRSQKELSTSTSDIQDTIEEMISLPPIGFLEDFKANYIDAELITANVLSSKRDEIAIAIRTVLDMVVNLALLFHGERGERVNRYAGNIMVFKSLSELNMADDNVKDRLRFWESNLDLNTYLGILDLRTELSTTTETDEPNPDDKLTPFAVAVPNVDIASYSNIEKLKKTDLLPGAPFTFITRQVQLFSKASDVIEEAKMFNFPPRVIEKISDYFGSDEGSSVRSFVSIPIEDHKIGHDALPIAVLNIHRDKEGLFGKDHNREKRKTVELFTPLIQPFCTILSRLLQRYESLLR